MGQYMYFYANIDGKLHYIDDVKDNGLHEYTRDIYTQYGYARPLDTAELEAVIGEYEIAIQRSEKRIAHFNELIEIALKADASLEERMETVETYKGEINSTNEYIKEIEDDITYLRHYVYLNCVFGDKTVWVGMETGRNYDPENPPGKEFEK